MKAVLSEDGRHQMETDRVRYMVCLDKMTELQRNQIIVAAAVRRLYDEAAGQVLSSLLALAGPALAHGDIVRQVSRQHGQDSEAARYLDQYLTILTDDRTRFLLKVGDDGGGEKHLGGCPAQSGLTIFCQGNIRSTLTTSWCPSLRRSWTASSWRSSAVRRPGCSGTSAATSTWRRELCKGPS